MPISTIVLVDDDAAVRHALAFSLELDGYAVQAYGDAETVLEGVSPSQGCYVIDVRLPGLDGIGLIERLRSRDISLPVVLITSHPDRALRERAGLLDVCIVEKPLMGDRLQLAIAQALDARA